MKKKLLIAAFLMTSCGAFAQSTQKALDATANLREAQVTSLTNGTLAENAATPLNAGPIVATEKRATPVKGTVQKSNQDRQTLPTPKEAQRNNTKASPAKK